MRDETSGGGGGGEILKKASDLLNGRCSRGIQDAQTMTTKEIDIQFHSKEDEDCG